MESVTRDTIVADVERRLHITFDGRTKPVTLEGARAEVSESVGSLAGMIRDADVDDDYFTRFEVVTLPANEGTIDLAAALGGRLLSLKRVSWLRSSTDAVPLERAGQDDLYSGAISPEAWTNRTARYRLAANGLSLYPTPSADTFLVIAYASDIPADPGTNWSVYMGAGWRRWIVADVCRKVSTADGQHGQASGYARERDDAWNQVVSANSSRDEHGVSRVRNVEGEWW